MSNEKQIAILYFDDTQVIGRIMRVNCGQSVSPIVSVRKEYTGLPVTTDALIFPLVYALRGLFNANFHIFYAFILLLVAFLFLYKFKVVKPKLKGMIIMTIVGIIELLLLIWLMK